MPKQKTITSAHTYRWKGLNKQGDAVRGESHAQSSALLKAELRRQGITPKYIRKKHLSFLRARKKISSQDVTLFIRQLATLLTAGLPILQAFELIAQQQTHPRFQNVLLNIKMDIESGNPPSSAFKKYPVLFNALLCHLTAAGEQSGTLDTMLSRIANYREKTEKLTKKVKKALVYPSSVITVAIIVTAILIVFVVPQFESLFKSFGSELPAMTRFIIQLSHFINSYIIFLLGLLFIIVIGFIQCLKRSENFAYSIDVFLLRLPFVGKILTKAIIARFARTLFTLFAAGLPMVDALKIVSGVTGNRVYSKIVLTLQEQISTGISLHSAMKSTYQFPAMTLQMIAIGETSGMLENMLSKIADFYETEVDNIVDNLSSLLEPAILVILGVLVGGLVIAMYLPIFQLGTVV